MYYIEPAAGALAAFLESFPDNTPVFMLNLLRFREEAAYPDDFQAPPCSGAEAYSRYSQAVSPLLERVGGEVVWQGRPVTMVIGPDDKHWNLMLLVRYPSKHAFLAMVGSDEYLAVVPHRTAALLDSRLIAHQQ